MRFFPIVYEAGKAIKSGTSTPQSPTYPPYFVSGVPTMVPIAPPSLVDKISPVPPSDGSLLTAGMLLLIISKLSYVLKFLLFIVVCFVVKTVKDTNAVLKSSQNMY